MKVKEVLTPNVERIPPDTSLADVASKMKSHDVGAVPVYDGDRLIGMVTDRDIVLRAVAESRDPRETRVRDIMSEGVIYCYEDDDVKTAAKTMREKQIRRLIVLDRNKRLAGIVSLGDLAVEASDKLAGKALEGISQQSSSDAQAH